MRKLLLAAAIALVAWLLFHRRDAAATLEPAPTPVGHRTDRIAPAAAPALSKSALSKPALATTGDRGDSELLARVRHMAPQATDRSPGIAGRDADADGVRDDVQLYIRDHWRDAPTRDAVQRYARLQQAFLATAASGGGDVHRAMESQLRSLECLHAIGGEALLTDSKNVLALTLNTPDRQRAYRQGMQAIAGGLFVSAAGDPCR